MNSVLSSNFAKLPQTPAGQAFVTWIQNLPVNEIRKERIATYVAEVLKNERSELFLLCNHIDTLPSEIGQFSHLKVLRLNCNELASLPKEIGECRELEILGLGNNRLTALVSEIGQCKLLNNLNISNNQIQFLPPELGQCSQLEILDARGNQIQFLPPELCLSANLREVDFSNNQLQFIPPEIRLLKKLEKLDLSNNQIAVIPPDIAHCSAISVLVICKNNLKFLPAELGYLMNLNYLGICDNPELKELPMSLESISGITYIHTSGTQVSTNKMVRILMLSKIKRERSEEEPLPTRLDLWNQYKPQPQPLEDVYALYHKIPKNQILNLGEWLLRLERTSDCTYSQKAFAELVWNILEHVVSNKDFQETFFNQISVNLERCQDRAAMALNEIYTSYRISALSQNQDPIQKLNIIVGCAKASILRRELSKRIVERQQKTKKIEDESVQIFLYYETKLDLQLESGAKFMAYEEYGKKDWIDEEELKKAIADTLLDELLQIPAFIKIFEDDEDYKMFFKEACGSLEREMESLNEKMPETENLFSEEYLNWQTNMNLLKEKYEFAAKEAKKDWAQKLLNKK